jgi:hypothetical protein
MIIIGKGKGKGKCLMPNPLFQMGKGKGLMPNPLFQIVKGKGKGLIQQSIFTRPNILPTNSINSKLFEPIGNKKVSSYIVCNHNYLLHGLVRKAAPDTFRGNNRFGAAGTDKKYWGKWSGPAGTPAINSKHKLDAITREISDEIRYRINNKDVVLLGHNNSPNGKNILYLIDYIETNNMIHFVFEMPYNIFNNVFPRAGRIKYSLLDSSHGEIDAIGSFTTSELLEHQYREMRYNTNNFMLSYYMETFNSKIVSILCNKYDEWNRKWTNNLKFDYLPDIIERHPYRNEI